MGALFSCCFRQRKDTAKQQAESVVVKFGNCMGKNVTATSYIVAGTGTCLVNTTLLQEKTYFEISLNQLGSFCIGVTLDMTSSFDGSLSTREGSYCLNSAKVENTWAEGDTIGFYYDLSGVRTVMSFTINGVSVPACTISNIKGEVWPAVSVAGGAVLSANFGKQPWKFPPTSGFAAPMMARDTM